MLPATMMVVVGCNPPPTSPPLPGPPPVPTITQPLEVRTSDGRRLGSVGVTAPVGEEVTLDAPMIAALGIDLSSVNARHLVVREPDQGQDLGAFVAMTYTGRVSFAPSQTARVIWMMNAINGADYERVSPLLGFTFVFQVSRYATVTRLTRANNTIDSFDVIDSSPSNIVAGLQLLNDTWRVAGVRYAELRWVGDTPGGDLMGGIGRHKISNAGGFHSGPLFIVHPNWPPLSQRNIAVEEAVEAFISFDNLFGQSTVFTLFGTVDGPTLLPAAADYLRFAVLVRR